MTSIPIKCQGEKFGINNVRFFFMATWNLRTRNHSKESMPHPFPEYMYDFLEGHIGLLAKLGLEFKTSGKITGQHIH